MILYKDNGEHTRPASRFRSPAGNLKSTGAAAFLKVFGDAAKPTRGARVLPRLLLTDILLRGEEKIKLRFRQVDQVSILPAPQPRWVAVVQECPGKSDASPALFFSKGLASGTLADCSFRKPRSAYTDELFCRLISRNSQARAYAQ